MEIKTAKTERQEADEALAEAKAMRATEKAKFLKTSEEQRATIVWALAERFASLRDDRKDKKDEGKGTWHVHHFFLLTTSALSSLAVEMTVESFFSTLINEESIEQAVKALSQGMAWTLRGSFPHRFRWSMFLECRYFSLAYFSRVLPVGKTAKKKGSISQIDGMLILAMNLPFLDDFVRKFIPEFWPGHG